MASGEALGRRWAAPNILAGGSRVEQEKSANKIKPLGAGKYCDLTNYARISPEPAQVPA